MFAADSFRKLVAHARDHISRRRSSRRFRHCKTMAAEIETLESKQLLATWAEIVGAVNAKYQIAISAHNTDMNLRIGSLSSVNVATSNEFLGLLSTAPSSASASIASALDATFTSASTNTSGLVPTWTAGFNVAGSFDGSGFFPSPTFMPGYVSYTGPSGSILATPFGWTAQIDKSITGSTITGDLFSDRFTFDGDSSGTGKISYSHVSHDPANTTQTAWNGNFDVSTQEFQFGFRTKDPSLIFSVGASGTPAALMMATGSIDITPGTGSAFHFDFYKTMSYPAFFNGTIEQLVGTTGGGDVKLFAHAHRNALGIYGGAGASYLNGGNSLAVIAAHNDPFNGPAFSGVTTSFSVDSIFPGLKLNGSTGVGYNLLTGNRISFIDQNLSLSYEPNTVYWKLLINAGVGQMGPDMWMLQPGDNNGLDLQWLIRVDLRR